MLICLQFISSIAVGPEQEGYFNPQSIATGGLLACCGITLKGIMLSRLHVVVLFDDGRDVSHYCALIGQGKGVSGSTGSCSAA